MDTPGKCGSPPPITSQPGATRCTQYRSDGAVIARCGSFANNGCRDNVLAPLTTQLLLPSSLEPRAPIASAGCVSAALSAGFTMSSGANSTASRAAR